MTDTASSFESHRRLRFAPDVVLQPTRDEALLLKLGAETAFVLNATAARIATLLGEGLPIDAIVAQLSSEYAGAPDAVAHDVRELVAALQAKGLLLGREQP